MSIHNMAAHHRELRARRRVRWLAALGAGAAVVLLAFGTGTLLSLVNNRFFCVAAGAIIAWGIWGGCHLNDRH